MALEELDLLDWKRRVFAIYAAVRASADPESAWRAWRAERDELFRDPSAVAAPGRRARAASPGSATSTTTRRSACSARSSRGDGRAARRRRERRREPCASGASAPARFELGGEPQELALYWLEGYGGGVFLPFADATSGHETYGGGRYLLDTVKGADLGDEDGRLVLDFNFAYNPSCAYDPRWVCPLTPPENRLAGRGPRRRAGIDRSA